MPYSRWTRLWIAISAASLTLGGIVWILKLAVVVATEGRVMYTGAAATFFDLGLVLLLLGSTAVGLRLTADGEAMSRVAGAVLSPIAFVFSFMVLQAVVVGLLDAARAAGLDPGPAYVREEASVLITAVAATAAGAMLLGGIVRRPRGTSGASFFRSSRLGGVSLMIGAVMFSLTKARSYVDPDDSMLGLFMFVGFGLWLVGLAALYARYAPFSGKLGKIGLGISIGGAGLLAVGHPFSFITGPDLFTLIILGALALAIGPLLFGLACWPSLAYGATARPAEVLPHRWRFLPLFTGLAGLAWFGSSGETTFFLFRTLFAAGWLFLGYVLWSDGQRKVQAIEGRAAGETPVLSRRA